MMDLDPKLLSLNTCPLCHSTARRKIFGLQSYSVFQCRECRLRYIDPCLSPEGTRYYYSSEEHLLELNPFHRSYYDYGDPAKPSKTVQDFERTLRCLEADGKSLFDVGCGNGLFLAVAKKRGWKVTGCEPSASNVATARSKFGLDIHPIGFDDFVPGAEKYDVISFWDVMEHLSDPHAFLDKAIGMLNPGGRIVVGGPNDLSFLRIMASAFCRMTAGRVQGPLRKTYLLEHVTYYTVATMKILLAKHGFGLERSFMSSTDLDKYCFAIPEKLLAASVLAAGKLLGLQNRFIAIFRARV